MANLRHIDTAALYVNEVEVGEAIREKISEGIWIFVNYLRVNYLRHLIFRSHQA